MAFYQRHPEIHGVKRQVCERLARLKSAREVWEEQCALVREGRP
jgi:hypothetical protein